MTCHLQVMKRNSRQREEEKENGGGMMDGQMLWFIMNQLRRGRRRVRALSHMCLVAIYIKSQKILPKSNWVLLLQSLFCDVVHSNESYPNY